jgi:DNA polymerase-1
MKNLIFDISPLAYRWLFSDLNDVKMLGMNIIRSKLLRNLIFTVEKLNPDKVFICFDCQGSNWRKQKYNFYKAHRAELREKQDVNWEEFYDFLNSFYDELRINFPFVSLRHDKLEADDIAAHLVRRYSNDINTIVTNDSDYLQLLKYKNVEVINALSGKKMVCESPKKFLEIKILTGDKSDNIPAVRARTGPATAEDLIDTGEIYKLLEEVDAQGNPKEIKRNYDRNKELIDLENTPEGLLMSLENLIDDYKMADTKLLTTYIRDRSLRDLFDNISSVRRILNKLVTPPDNQLARPL